MVRCCKNCMDRYPNCHSECKMYQKEKTESIKEQRWLKQTQFATTIPKNTFNKFLASGKSPKHRP